MRCSFSSPLGVGLIFGLIGIGLTIIGIIRGNVPFHPASISMALVVGGGRGIGRASAAALERAGWTVEIADKNTHENG